MKKVEDLKFRFYYKDKCIDELTLKEISERNFHWADDVIVTLETTFNLGDYIPMEDSEND